MDVQDLIRQAMVIIVVISAPPVIAALIIGVLVSIIQTSMQLQDQTIPFCVKFISVSFVLLVTGGWMSNELIDFTNKIFIYLSRT
ncbi:TPA: type III secretion system export apparatus subunit SctS [Serratia marcescens]